MKKLLYIVILLVVLVSGYLVFENIKINRSWASYETGEFSLKYPSDKVYVSKESGSENQEIIGVFIKDVAVNPNGWILEIWRRDVSVEEAIKLTISLMKDSPGGELYEFRTENTRMLGKDAISVSILGKDSVLLGEYFFFSLGPNRSLSMLASLSEEKPADRNGNPVPQSAKDLYEQVIRTLKLKF